jgi:hypothetical protein
MNKYKKLVKLRVINSIRRSEDSSENVDNQSQFPRENILGEVHQILSM